MYLSPDSRNGRLLDDGLLIIGGILCNFSDFFPPVLQTIDPTRVYVLGGVVDESVDKVTDIIYIMLGLSTFCTSAVW